MAEHYPEIKTSAKIRLPLTDDILVKERIPRLLQTGISFLTIHGRTLYENKTKVRECHLDRIKLAIETAQKLQPGFPVVANGGVESYADVGQVLKDTGASAVMSSEALLETPNVFSSTYKNGRNSARQQLDQQLGFAHDYLDWCSVYPPLPGVLGGQGSFNIARGHLFKFLHRYLMDQPDLRDKLGSHKMSTLVESRSLVNELKNRYERLSEEELEARPSSQANSSWYRRHRSSLENGLVHTRQVGGATAADALKSTMSIEEKKEMLRKRISKLKEQRLMKN
jgi:tRNA-dihydrouridine synthase